MTDAAKTKPQAGATAPVVKIMPMAPAASLRPRHRRLILSFALMVVLPLLVTVGYLWLVAKDQYASTTGFTVRREEGGGAADLLGNLGKFAGGVGGASDSDILYEFIQSQEMAQTVDRKLGLSAIYSANWGSDPLFSLWPGASVEDLLWYWRRMVRISYDQNAGLIELRVLAFDPDTAQSIAQEIVDESQSMINGLNAAARNDLMHNAEIELAQAVERLKQAREAMTKFRTRTQIVDPNADLQGQVRVINNLQQKLAETLIEYDERAQTNADDPRLPHLKRTVNIIRARIAQERETFANRKIEGVGKDYPTLMSVYEGLVVDREYAEETYRAALAAVDASRAKIARQSRYLATYVAPTLPQSSQYPQRFVLSGLAAVFLLLAWSIMALIYYSLRDRR